MSGQPNKPGGDVEDDGTVRPVEDRRSVKNQSSVTPDQYPEPASGKPEQTGKR